MHFVISSNYMGANKTPDAEVLAAITTSGSEIVLPEHLYPGIVLYMGEELPNLPSER
jgi:hypothetical protein